MSATLKDLKDFASRLALMKAEAGRLGLVRTMHAFDRPQESQRGVKVNDVMGPLAVVGYEIEDLIGKMADGPQPSEGSALRSAALALVKVPGSRDRLALVYRNGSRDVLARFWHPTTKTFDPEKEATVIDARFAHPVPTEGVDWKTPTKVAREEWLRNRGRRA